MTALDARFASAADAPCGWSHAELLRMIESHSREIARRESEAYAYGLTAGIETGRAQAEAEMDAWWAMLARRIRDDAHRVPTPIPEPAIRPQPDDSIWFTAVELAARAGAE